MTQSQVKVVQNDRIVTQSRVIVTQSQRTVVQNDLIVTQSQVTVEHRHVMVAHRILIAKHTNIEVAHRTFHPAYIDLWEPQTNFYGAFIRRTGKPCRRHTYNLRSCLRNFLQSLILITPNRLQTRVCNIFIAGRLLFYCFVIGGLNRTIYQ